MKKVIVLTLVILITNYSFAQISGNINYQNQIKFPNSNIEANFTNSNALVVSVKGLANVKADSYVAIFSLTQTGKTTQEVNELIDQRINQALSKIKSKPDVKTYVDMISFVPVYEYEVQKKLFSKNTYNEIPVGFELKKNIHIQYKDPNYFNDIMAILSNVEIYDLVRVDYFSSELEAIKKELRRKAKVMLQEKMQDYASILNRDLDSLDKEVADIFKVVLPVEMYKSYQSYSSSSLNLKKAARVNTATKSQTLYYQPIINKDFDFVVNPTILEPVIQVMYNIKLNIKNINPAKIAHTPVTTQKVNKEFILITPSGELKTLML